ncbi:MAG: cobaltochelatase subunit CobN, partial [Nitriliruptor sp.]
LFGYDATTGVVQDWQYDTLVERYVLDPEVRDFLERSNPWALRGITERLLEAAQRGLWAEPAPERLEQLRAAYLETEGLVEERGETPVAAGATGRVEAGPRGGPGEEMSR